MTIGAMTKGAGMIDPNLTAPHATMLCFVTTDAAIDNALLGELPRQCQTSAMSQARSSRAR